MEIIRPISDLRNNFTEISKQVKEYNQPVFLTKNGYGDMVVMSINKFNELNFNSEIINKLKEAEKLFNNDDKKYSHDDVFSRLRGILNDQNM